jgi:hypothetical protein
MAIGIPYEILILGKHLSWQNPGATPQSKEACAG